MRWALIFHAVCLMTALRAAEDGYTKSVRVDGLPIRLNETGWLSEAIESDSPTIHLSEPFSKALGIKIPEGNFVLYHVPTGNLICHLDEKSHDLVDHVIRELYRHEETVATCRAYLALLEPMSPDKRMYTVMRIGFLPDPLVASVVHRIRQIRQKELEAYDPFDPKPEPSHLSPEEEARARSYEKILPGLIEVSLQRMKASLEILDRRDGPEADAKAKPPAAVPGH